MSEKSELRKELLEKRALIQSAEMNISIGELISMYENEEINLEPEYQRLFRWPERNKYDFIESLLLNYPIPPIFVMQTADGVWDVIDGVQRLSTIYEFVGLLGEELIIEDVRVLKNLIGKTWSQGEESLDKATKIDFRRSAMPVIVLKYESDQRAKYELFRRINTGSESLSAAEVRSALILMLNKDLHRNIKKYSKNKIFKKLINVSENKKSENFGSEIITRFIAYRNIDLENIKNSENIDNIIDTFIESALIENTIDFENEMCLLQDLIIFLSENIDPYYGFKKYNSEKNVFQGQFQWFIFETIVFGLTKNNNFKNLISNEKDVSEIKNKIKKLKGSTEYFDGVTQRVPARVKGANTYSKEVFDFG